LTAAESSPELSHSLKMSSSGDDGQPGGRQFAEGIDKVKTPNLAAFLAYKPTNVISGVLAGAGNTVGGAVLAVGEYHPTEFTPCHKLS
jgi:hypothetical protein